MDTKEPQDPAKVLAEVEAPSGYGTHDTYFAARYKQGSRVFYVLDVTVPQLIAMVPAPDPDKPPPGNRRINPGHAKKFGDYIIAKKDWVCPPVLLRVPDGEFEFELLTTAAGTEFGYLSVPKLSRLSLHITDGQHRVLGFHLGWERLEEMLSKAREGKRKAELNGEDGAVIAEFDKRMKDLKKARERLAQERIGLNVMVVEDPVEYQQVFVDIADNALGISRSVSVRFDRRKVVNRALESVMTHELLDGRVDEQSDRITKTSQNLMGAKHVTDIIRAANVGPGRRISKRQEDELKDISVAANANRFLDALVASFPEIAALKDGDKSPGELRSTSLLGSAVMLRVLAGAYGELVVVKRAMTDEQVVAFFRSLPSMTAPVTAGSKWMETGVFLEGANAPSARQGDITKLSNALVKWGAEWAEAHPGYAKVVSLPS